MPAWRGSSNLVDLFHQEFLRLVDRDSVPDGNVQSEDRRVDRRPEFGAGLASYPFLNECLVKSGTSSLGLAWAEGEEPDPAQNCVQHHQSVNVIASERRRMIRDFDEVSLPWSPKLDSSLT